MLDITLATLFFCSLPLRTSLFIKWCTEILLTEPTYQCNLRVVHIYLEDKNMYFQLLGNMRKLPCLKKLSIWTFPQLNPIHELIHYVYNILYSVVTYSPGNILWQGNTYLQILTPLEFRVIHKQLRFENTPWILIGLLLVIKQFGMTTNNT